MGLNLKRLTACCHDLSKARLLLLHKLCWSLIVPAMALRLVHASNLAGKLLTLSYKSNAPTPGAPRMPYTGKFETLKARSFKSNGQPMLYFPVALNPTKTLRAHRFSGFGMQKMKLPGLSTSPFQLVPIVDKHPSNEHGSRKFKVFVLGCFMARVLQSCCYCAI